MNRENLVKLAKYILSGVTDNQFNMGKYRRDIYGFSKDFVSINDCGTVGCALGWSPFVPGLEAVETEFNPRNCALIFYKYSSRVFEINDGELCWYFLFDSGWSTIDNTRKGFVKRVLYLIEGGNDLKRKTCQYKNIDPNKIYEY